MRRRLYLMRHADVSYAGGQDPDLVALTPRGREQAAAARRALQGVELDIVVASGLPRTRETAAIVAPRSEPETWPDFDEWRGGRLDELAIDDLERAFVRGLHVAGEGERFLGGETLGELLDRLLPAFERLLAREWNTAVAVFHGGVNRALLSYALAGERAYFSPLEQAPACINVLDLDDAGWIVRIVNYVPYEPLHAARTTTMEDIWAEIIAWGGDGAAEPGA